MTTFLPTSTSYLREQNYLMACRAIQNLPKASFWVRGPTFSTYRFFPIAQLPEEILNLIL